MKDLTFQARKLKVEEYQLLRQSTNWSSLEDVVVERALQQDLFAICVLHDKRTIGMGRVIGDGGIYYYIQDVIVLPEYQNRGVGRQIMLYIETYLQGHAPAGSFVGLMAAEGVKDFYRKFGYSERGKEKPGMYKTVKSLKNNP